MKNKSGRKRKYSWKDTRNGFLFALPWIIGFTCFSIDVYKRQLTDSAFVEKQDAPNYLLQD